LSKQLKTERHWSIKEKLPSLAPLQPKREENREGSARTILCRRGRAVLIAVAQTLIVTIKAHFLDKEGEDRGYAGEKYRSLMSRAKEVGRRHTERCRQTTMRDFNETVCRVTMKLEVAVCLKKEERSRAAYRQQPGLEEHLHLRHLGTSEGGTSRKRMKNAGRMTARGLISRR